MRRSIRPADFALYKSISEPSLSPDGASVCFSVRQANLSDDGYDSDIYVADLKKRKVARFTSGNKDSDPLWSPDGSSILFSSRRGFAKDEKGSCLYLIPSAGGEARLLVKRSEGMELPARSHDSKRIFYLSNVGKKEKDDVKVIKRFGYWFNGVGFTYNKRKHLFSIGTDGGTPSQVTRGEFNIVAFSVSHDGSRAAYAASTVDAKTHIIDLFVLTFKSGRRVKITRSNMEITALDWSPDDRRIAVRDDFASGFASHEVIWIADPGRRRMARLDKVGRNKANGLNSDVRAKAHGPHTVVWEKDGIYHLQADGGAVGIYRLRP
jgi:acylaminoacyl-peptidase